MLSNTLNTNEIKDAGGVECEFQRLSTSDRKTEFALITESPSLPFRFVISHQETGSGLTKRRRSLVRFDKTVAGTVDTTKTCNVSAYCVLDAPIGALISNAEFKAVLAGLMSFLASTGATTTILYDCSGNGANALTTGGL